MSARDAVDTDRSPAPAEPRQDASVLERRRVTCAAGLFLALLGIYLLTSPGRIDSIDGQMRFEVTKNWLAYGEPMMLDEDILWAAIPDPRTGKFYSFYLAAPSVAAMPLMLMSRALPGQDIARDLMFFSFTGAFFSAVLGAALVLAFGLFGVGLGRSLFWSAAFCLGTLWWPSAVTVLDQNQHATVLFVSVILAWQAGRRSSNALAVVAGLVGGLLFVYQESYGLLLPFAAVATFATSDEGGERTFDSFPRQISRPAVVRYLLYGAASATGLALFAWYNLIRYGSVLSAGRYGSAESAPEVVFGDPLAGFSSLLVSPGKSLFLFSPPLLLAVWGLYRLRKRAPLLVTATALVSLVHLLFVSQFCFFGGDWCWGPRYTLVFSPLLALGLVAVPLSSWKTLRGAVVGGVLAAGLVVQLAGISVDYFRFFDERDLPGWFWIDNQWFYFRHSQLAARFSEIADIARTGIPPEHVRFNPTPGRAPTYGTFYGEQVERGPEWIRQFGIYYTWRPWPLWMRTLPPEERPVGVGALAAFFAAIFACGVFTIWRSTRSGVRDGKRGDTR